MKETFYINITSPIQKERSVQKSAKEGKLSFKKKNSNNKDEGNTKVKSQKTKPWQVDLLSAPAEEEGPRWWDPQPNPSSC